MYVQLQLFLNHLSQLKNYSEHTVVSYRNDLEQLVGYVTVQYEVKDWDMISHPMIRSWMADLMDRGYESGSIARKLSSVKSLYKYLLRQEMVKKNPSLKLSAPKKKKRLPKSIRSQDLQQLSSRIEKESTDFAETRDLLIVELLYATGMRRSELLGLTLDKVDLASGQITVLGKGNKERIIPLISSLIDRLKLYISLRGEREVNHMVLFITDRNKPLYPKYVYNVVKRVLMQISTAQFTSPHALRHSFATHLLDEGADLNAVKELLGHANLSATEVYTHNTVEKLKRSYASAHPKS